MQERVPPNLTDVKDQVTNDLLNLPQIILDKGNELLRLRTERDELTLIVKSQENSMLSEIDKEYDEKKDKDLSTISKRQAKAETRLKASDEYILRKKKLEKLDKDIKIVSINLEFINNKFKSARALALLLGGN